MRSTVTLTVFLVVLSPPAAFAEGQAEPPADPRADARVHLGPFYLTPSLRVEELGVDTNVFNDAEQQQDFTFTVAPHAELRIPFGRRALITTLASTDLVYYHRFASERSLNPDVSVRGDLFLNRLTLFAEPSYVNSRQRMNYELDARARRDERAATVGAQLRISSKSGVEVAARGVRIRFDADATVNGTSLRETLNRESRQVSLTMRHAVTPFTTLVLRADAESNRFEVAPLRDSDTVRVTPGVVFNPRALISGSAFVGVRRFETLTEDLEDFTGVVASATLAYTPGGATRVSVTVDRDVTYSYEPLQPYFVVDGYGLTVRRHIVGKVDVTAGAQRYTYSYRDLLLPGAQSGDRGRVDITRVWSAEVGYRLGQSARVGFGAVYRERQSNSARFKDYEGLRFATTIEYGVQP